MHRSDQSKIKRQLDIYYSKRPQESANIAGYLRNFPSSELFVDDEDNISFVAVRDGGRILTDMLSDSYIPFLKKLLISGSNVTFSGVELGLGDKILQYCAGRVIWRNPCYLYYFPDNYANAIAPKAGRLGDIDICHAGLIDRHYNYRGEGSLQDIQECIQNRPGSAVYIDNQPVSWALLHRDDTMGFLYTLPNYRHNGCAYAIMADLINKTIASKRLPFAHIVHGNTASVKLTEKSGLKFSHDVVWFGIEIN